MNYATFVGRAPDKVISCLHKAGDGTETEGETRARIQARIPFGFRSCQIEFRVIQAASGQRVRFCGGPGEGEDEVSEDPACAQAVSVAQPRRSRSISATGELVIDAVNANTEGQLSDTQGKRNQTVETRGLGVLQPSNWNRCTATNTDRVAILGGE